MFRLESYLLSGYPIELDTLGKIYQPTLKELYEKKVDYFELVIPFIILEKVNSKSESTKFQILSQFKLISNVPNLEFKGTNNIVNIYETLINALKFLYKTDDVEWVEVANKKGMLIKQEETCLIHENNFDELCNIVLDMFCIDKKKIIEEENKELSDIEKYILEKRKELEKKRPKKNKSPLLTMINYVAHVNETSYDLFNVYNLTIYQLEHVYETYQKKESYNAYLQVRLTGMGKEDNKIKHWLED